MKVLVTGGRMFGVVPKGLRGDALLEACRQARAEEIFLFEQLDALYQEHRFTALAHGGARGTDMYAGIWAGMGRVPCYVFEADWNRLGNFAGPERNQRMLDQFKPDLVVAFPGGSGTADMIRRAQLANVTVLRRKMK